MRGKLFFHGPRPLKRASISVCGRAVLVLASTWATARTCSGSVAGQAWAAGLPVATPSASAEDEFKSKSACSP